LDTFVLFSFDTIENNYWGSTMSETSDFDLVIKNVQVVRPNHNSSARCDLGIKNGKFAHIAPEINQELGNEVFDAKELSGFPGLVDSHQHIGIYQPLPQDAITETKAATMGGAITALTYIRTGQYYLNRGGAYKDFFPEALKLSEEIFFVDYGYHLAPISSSHIDELQSSKSIWFTVRD
jgi:allantoinase